MPLMSTPPLEAVIPELITSLDSDLSYLLDDSGVPREVQAKLAEVGYKSCRIFARAAETAAELRQMVKDDMTLDPTADAKARVVTAALINVWEAARVRNDQRIKAQAEQKVHDVPVAISKGQHLELTRAFARAHSKELEDKECPAPGYVESLLEMVEAGELETEKLQSVVTKEQASGEPFGACRIQGDGTVKFTRKAAESAPPTSPEELRGKYKCMARAWELVRLKLPSKPFLSEFRMTSFDTMVDWLLSEDVYRTSVKAEGFTYRPSWATLLEFEFQLRRKVYKLINDGSTFNDAVSTAISDHSLLQKHFLNPVSVSAGAAAAAGSSPRRSRSPYTHNPYVPRAPSHPPPGHRRGGPRERWDTGGRRFLIARGGGPLWISSSPGYRR